jgi:hypothetical protein
MLPMYIGYMMVFKKKVIECFFLNFLNIWAWPAGWSWAAQRLRGKHTSL